MGGRRFIVGLAALLVALASAADPRDYRDPNFDYFVAGDPAAPRAAHPQFLLALMGGGGWVDAAYSALARHAGGGHIVILRAVSDDSFDADGGNYDAEFMTHWGPVTSAQTVVFHHREAAFDARVAAILRGADGIFLAGGDQANYIRYWKGTPVQELLNAHVAAGRPLGGSSAGLAVLGHYAYTAFDGASLESAVALTDPDHASVTLEDDFLHFQGLGAVITDSHFSQRARLGRLVTFLARIDRDHPGVDALGIGVDENSALMVDEAGGARLAAGSAGAAWIVRLRPGRRVVRAGTPLTLADVRVERMGPASRLDLGTRQVDAPAGDGHAAIERGVPRAPSWISSIMGRPDVHR